MHRVARVLGQLKGAARLTTGLVLAVLLVGGLVSSGNPAVAQTKAGFAATVFPSQDDSTRPGENLVLSFEAVWRSGPNTFPGTNVLDLNSRITHADDVDVVPVLACSRTTDTQSQCVGSSNQGAAGRITGQFKVPAGVPKGQTRTFLIQLVETDHTVPEGDPVEFVWISPGSAHGLTAEGSTRFPASPGGDAGTYRVRATNTGSAAAPSSSLTISAPSGFSFPAAGQPTGCTAAINKVICDFDLAAATGFALLDIKFAADSSVAPESEFTPSAWSAETITGTAFDQIVGPLQTTRPNITVATTAPTTTTSTTTAPTTTTSTTTAPTTTAAPTTATTDATTPTTTTPPPTSTTLATAPTTSIAPSTTTAVTTTLTPTTAPATTATSTATTLPLRTTTSGLPMTAPTASTQPFPSSTQPPTIPATASTQPLPPSTQAPAVPTTAFPPATAPPSTTRPTTLPVAQPPTDAVPQPSSADADGDGLLDVFEGVSDRDLDGIPNYLDVDSDGDGLLDLIEAATDPDGDGVPNYLDLNSDNDCLGDAAEGLRDRNRNGVPDHVDASDCNPPSPQPSSPPSPQSPTVIFVPGAAQSAPIADAPTQLTTRAVPAEIESPSSTAPDPGALIQFPIRQGGPAGPLAFDDGNSWSDVPLWFWLLPLVGLLFALLLLLAGWRSDDDEMVYFVPDDRRPEDWFYTNHYSSHI